MVVSCSVSGCVNRRQKGSNVNFFSLVIHCYILCKLIINYFPYLVVRNIKTIIKLFPLFRFPLKNPERNQLWITAIRRKGFVPTKNSCICSEHSVQSNYDLKPGDSYKLYLKETAVNDS